MNPMRGQDRGMAVPAAGEATSGIGAAKGRRGKKAAVPGVAEPSAPPVEHFSNAERSSIRASLLSWYDTQHRVLPWRRTPHSRRGADAALDPRSGVAAAPDALGEQQFAYWVWVSEIMLQQTQVATVTPYFQKWVAKWPMVSDLAAASIEDVNSMWAGLGYYRRARYLLDGAKYVVEKLSGNFPATAKELLQVPGIGPYTAAAVGSIAFDDASAAVDGNVIRVVSRLRALSGDPTKLGAVHTTMASEMLDASRPGCFNQAVMELGATVCRPVNPECSKCPLSRCCRAHADWEDYLQAGGDADADGAPRVTSYPGKKPTKEKREQSVAVSVLQVVERQSAPGGKGSAAGATAVAKGGQAKKRQRTMFEFASSAVSEGSSVKAALSNGNKWFLLMQRPEGGLLGGLWEFPSVVYEGALSRQQRMQRLAELLARVLGVPAAALSGCAANGCSARRDGVVSVDGLQFVSSHSVGTHVHVFSHIKQTSHIEVLTVLVDDLQHLISAADAARAEAASGMACGGGHRTQSVRTRSAMVNQSETVELLSSSPGEGSGSDEDSDGAPGRCAGARRKAPARAKQDPKPALLEEQTALPQLRWVRASDMAAEGVPTLTKKIYKLAVGGQPSSS